jgi:hypothetical protein
MGIEGRVYRMYKVDHLTFSNFRNKQVQAGGMRWQFGILTYRETNGDRNSLNIAKTS